MTGRFRRTSKTVNRRMRETINPLTRVVTLAGLLLPLSGCATFGFLGKDENQSAKADSKNPATHVLCLWQPAEGRGLDNLPTRGFAGQIAFFAGQSSTPVEVEGDVEILLFDDRGTPAQQAQPIHVFRFVDGSWQTHLTQTAWGPTYHIFLPYVRKGNHRAGCALCVRLNPKEGPRVNSDLANITLLGKGSSPDLIGAVREPPRPTVDPTRLAFDGGQIGKERFAGSPAALESNRQGGSGVQPTNCPPRFESFSIPFVVDQVRGN